VTAVRVRVEQTTLPGIGVRHDVLTGTGHRIGVVSHRDGRRELVVFDEDDPDLATVHLALSDAEAAVLADLLGTSVVLGQLSRLTGANSGGLVTEQVALPAGSGYAGRRLGETKARARTGASIVAVVRDGDIIPSPAPSFRFEAGDSVIVVGTRAGVDGVTAILAESDPDS